MAVLTRLSALHSDLHTATQYTGQQLRAVLVTLHIFLPLSFPRVVFLFFVLPDCISVSVYTQEKDDINLNTEQPPAIHFLENLTSHMNRYLWILQKKHCFELNKDLLIFSIKLKISRLFLFLAADSSSICLTHKNLYLSAKHTCKS